MVLKASSVPTSAENCGKNKSLNTRADAVPYRKKSYHSIVEPTSDASATLVASECRCASVSSETEACVTVAAMCVSPNTAGTICSADRTGSEPFADSCSWYCLHNVAQPQAWAIVWLSSPRRIGSTLSVNRADG